jgi:hypothetical protein
VGLVASLKLCKSPCCHTQDAACFVFWCNWLIGMYQAQALSGARTRSHTLHVGQADKSVCAAFCMRVAVNSCCSISIDASFLLYPLQRPPVP